MEALVLYASLVIARVATFVSVLPLFGGETTPRLVRVGLVLALSGLYLLSLPPTLPAGSLFLIAGRAAWPVYGLALAREILLGALLGYAFNLLLAPARIAGAFLTQQLGLTFGDLIGATAESGTGPLTLIFEGLSVLLLLGLDLHHTFFIMLHQSFALYPVGGGQFALPMQNLVAGLTLAEETGIALAAPIALCLFLTTAILSLLTRVAPSLNLYSVGFPLQLSAGLAAILLLLPNLAAGLLHALGRMQAILPRLW